MNTYNIIKNHVQEWDCIGELTECYNNYLYEFKYKNVVNYAECVNVYDDHHVAIQHRELGIKDEYEYITYSAFYKKVVEAIKDMIKNHKQTQKQALEYFNIYTD